jgi:hypothetical protein
MSNPQKKVKASPALTQLETRVADRKRELIAEIVEHKKSLRVGAPEAIDRLKDRLFDLTHIIKMGVVNGWANVSESATLELDAWIAR